MRRILLILFSMLFLLSGCASSRPGNTYDLNGLQSIGYVSSQQPRGPHHKQPSEIRLMAIRETAMSLGAQAGLAFRAKQIDKLLEKNAYSLNHTYNFYGMLLDHDVLPPVLAEAQDTLRLDGPDTIRLASKVYRIVQQAQFVTAPPTWRDFLWMAYPQPPIPNNILLPKTRLERKVWAKYIKIGWDKGVKQANEIFSANLARLNRDYKGMTLYLKLYAQNMVSAPYVARTKLGITGNGQHMRIDDQVLRITALPQLNLNGNTWDPGLIPVHRGIINYDGKESPYPRGYMSGHGPMSGNGKNSHGTS